MPGLFELFCLEKGTLTPGFHRITLKPMKKSRKIFLLLIAVLILSVMIGALFHQHHADENLLHCSICQFIYQAFFLVVLTLLVLGLHEKAMISFPLRLRFSFIPLIASLQNRAPPAVS